MLVLTESWLDSSPLNDEYSIPGRYLEHKDRIDNNGGCVLMNVISSYNNV